MSSVRFTPQESHSIIQTVINTGDFPDEIRLLPLRTTLSPLPPQQEIPKCSSSLFLSFLSHAFCCSACFSPLAVDTAFFTRNYRGRCEQPQAQAQKPTDHESKRQHQLRLLLTALGSDADVVPVLGAYVRARNERESHKDEPVDGPPPHAHGPADGSLAPPPGTLLPCCPISSPQAYIRCVEETRRFDSLERERRDVRTSGSEARGQHDDGDGTARLADSSNGEGDGDRGVGGRDRLSTDEDAADSRDAFAFVAVPVDGDDDADRPRGQGGRSPGTSSSTLSRVRIRRSSFLRSARASSVRRMTRPATPASPPSLDAPLPPSPTLDQRELPLVPHDLAVLEEHLASLFHISSTLCHTPTLLCAECARTAVKEREVVVESERERAVRWSALLADLSMRMAERENDREAEIEREWQEALALAEEEEAAAAAAEAELAEVLAVQEAAERDREERAAAASASLAAANARLASLWDEYEESSSDAVAQAEQEKVEQALQSSLPLNEAYHISHAGPLVTINGLRLGRLPSTGSGFSLSMSQALPWPETNAALGYLVALLNQLTLALSHGPLSGARRLRFAGSFSTLVLQRNVLPLHGSGALSITKILRYGRFDAALRHLAAIVRELAASLSASDPSFRLPFAFTPNPTDATSGTPAEPPTHVGGSSLSLGVGKSSAVEWSRACKCLVGDVKWMLVWVAASGVAPPE